MFKQFIFILVNLSLASATLRQLKRVRVCPTSCPPCVECDTKRGTCSLPLTGSVCKVNNLDGTCSSAGICVQQSQLPPVPLKKCQTYNCPTPDTCSVVYTNDATDCTYPGNGVHSYCLNNGCKAVIEALTVTLPSYNVGCLGFPDGVLCDTNLNLFDGESCQNELCKLPNGQYNGVLPPN